MRAYFGGIGGSRRFGVLGASVLASLLAGCGWFDSTPTLKVIPTRPGAERSVPAGGLQTSGNGGQYDGDIRPVDEARPIGSVIPDKGGQKAQLDAVAKDAAERDAAAREAAAKRKAEGPSAAPITPASAPAGEGVPVPPPAPGTAVPLPPPGPVTSTPVPPPAPDTTTPLPPPGPVTSAPVPPPATAPQATVPSPAPAPASPTTTQ